MAPKSASFDVLGTCFGFETAIDQIQARLGSKMPKDRTRPFDPSALFFGWFFAAQRDFTYTSLAGKYTPIAQVLKGTFIRACAVVDIPIDIVSDDDISAVMAEMMKLPPRPGLKKCYDGLRDAGWDVYGVTNGGKETSLKYYELAGIELDAQHLLSCDEISVAKPDPKVYANTHRHLTSQGAGEGDGERWFIAAHAWDLLAAKTAGFKVAYLDFEEHDACTSVFGQFDLCASSMEDLLEKMKAL